MTEEMESPVEKLGEELQEIAENAKENWLRWSALLSALFAVLAATTGLKSAHYESDAMIEQIEASDQWGYYQAKGIKALVISNERNLLKQLGKPETGDQDNQVDKYKKEQEEIKAEATKKVEEARDHFHRHEILSYAVTLFQVSIAVVAIGVLTRIKGMVLFSVFLSLTGIGFLLYGLLT